MLYEFLNTRFLKPVRGYKSAYLKYVVPPMVVSS